MDNPKEKIEKLIKVGNDFTYENFTEKGSSGYSYKFVPEWVAWEKRCRDLIEKLFGVNSPVNLQLDTAMSVDVFGWGEDKFKLRRGYILKALATAIDVLEEDTYNELSSNLAQAPGSLSNKVFVVHGHDNVAKSSLEIFLTEIGLDPVVLHRQADEGNTLIEKFEKHSDVGYAFILLTPDECAYLSSESNLDESKRNIEYRARPNVIFEFGYFVGKLGRKRVCCLHTGDVALPSDVNGMIYKKYVASIEEAAYSIIKDLKAAGYEIK